MWVTNCDSQAVWLWRGVGRRIQIIFAKWRPATTLMLGAPFIKVLATRAGRAARWAPSLCLIHVM